MFKKIIGISVFGILCMGTYGAFKFHKYAQKELLKRVHISGWKSGWKAGENFRRNTHTK